MVIVISAGARAGVGSGVPQAAITHPIAIMVMRKPHFFIWIASETPFPLPSPSTNVR